MQNWNDILNYIKRNIGIKFNQLELTDEEIVDGLKNDVLPLFSQFVPLKKQTYISSNDLVEKRSFGSGLWIYKLPVDEQIIDITNAFPNEYYSSDKYTDPFYDTKYSRENIRQNRISSSDPQGIEMFFADQVYSDILAYASPRNTWKPILPDKIEFDFEIYSAIIEYDTVHTELQTIYSDMYQMVFKPLCLGNTQIWLANLRSKFQDLTSPIGNIRLNFERLEQSGRETIEKTMTILEGLPPDHLVEVSV
jgi:hypothetical protein